MGRRRDEILNGTWESGDWIRPPKYNDLWRIARDYN